MESVTRNILILLTTLMIAGCSSPAPQNDPYNDPDSQRSRADKAQDEMAR